MIQQGASEEAVNALSAHYDRWIAHEEMKLNQNLSNRYNRDRSITFWYAQRLNAPEEAMAAILDLKKQADGESTGNALYEKEYLPLFQPLLMLMKAEGVYQPFIENGFVPIVVGLYGKTEDVLFGSILLGTLYFLLKTGPSSSFQN